MTARSIEARDDASARLSNMLIAAHASGECIPEFAETAIVISQADAYRVQAAVAKQIGATAGWKVGRKTPAAVPVFAPLFENRIYPSGATLPRGDFRLWLLEAELVFRIGQNLPPEDAPYGRQEIFDAIDDVSAAFEIIDSRFAAWPDLTPQLLVADLLSHGAMVIGSGISPPPGTSFERAKVRLNVDEIVAVEQEGGNPAGDVVELVIWLANHLASGGVGLRAGDLVTTGSYTGMTHLAPGGYAEASFAGVGSVAVARSI
jgi:2-keto-4-pentenoate hydratase